LITAYLSDRKQFILHQSEKLNVVDVKFGVPQGSNLGALFFLIYINDISNFIKCDVKLFADDTYLMVHVTNPSLLELNTNEALTVIEKWINSNKLAVNPLC